MLSMKKYKSNEIKLLAFLHKLKNKLEFSDDHFNEFFDFFNIIYIHKTNDENEKKQQKRNDCKINTKTYVYYRI